MSETQTEQTPLEEALAAMERAIDAVKAEAEKLPALPLPLPECCKDRMLKVIERGYTRCTTLDEPDPGETPQAYTDGWDDYSEAGDFEWIECLNCGQQWKTPEGLDYV